MFWSTTTTRTTPSIASEQLPVYRKDPDTVSVASSAPSYKSETPTYTSRRSKATGNAPSSTTGRKQDEPRHGLPAMQFAQGFKPRPQNMLLTSSGCHSVDEWTPYSPPRTNIQLHAVPRRRSSQVTVGGSVTNLPITNTPSGPSSTSSTSTLIAVHPQEDPDLVGKAAAKQAREQRIYRESCLRGDDALRQESNSWDFMLNQMSDWEERERSWNNFRDRVTVGGCGVAAKRKSGGLRGRLAGLRGLR